MNQRQTVTAAISYIEENLSEKISLEQIARNIHYSKYYLAHEFSEQTTFSIYDYLKRRRLNEATKLLATTDKKIIEIALNSGYQTHRSFSKAFSELFKISPKNFKKNKLPFEILDALQLDNYNSLKKQHVLVRTATKNELSKIIFLIRQLKSGLPYLNENEFSKSLHARIIDHEVLVALYKKDVVGILVFSQQCNRIDLLESNRFLRSWAIEEQMLDYLLTQYRFAQTSLTIISFRENDKLADGQQQRLLQLGFQPNRESMYLFYPTQEYILYGIRS